MCARSGRGRRASRNSAASDLPARSVSLSAVHVQSPAPYGIGNGDAWSEWPLLRQTEVVPYLLQRDLLHPAMVVEGDLLVTDASRRNRNFRVLSERGASYLLKQGIGNHGVRTVGHEAAVYRVLREDSGPTGIKRYLPTCHGYDSERGVLMLELLRGAESLREYHFRRHRFPTSLAKQLGEALGGLHHEGPAAAHLTGAKGPAWVLSLHHPDVSIFREASAANLQLIRLLQGQEQFGHLLDELHEGWTSDAFIHGDVKADNVIVFAPKASRRKTRLALVDWEMAGPGDACWDVGSVFGEYLATWLLSMPITGEAPPDRFVELARYPLEAIQPAVRAFWNAYVGRMGFDARSSHRRLTRSVRYGAARLLQTCYESSQTTAHLLGTTRCMLQLSVNILRRPLEASVHLLGIPLSESMPG
jgi:Ser/Thr protein kinase RdoA (MazF antagonist)